MSKAKALAIPNSAAAIAHLAMTIAAYGLPWAIVFAAIHK